MTNQQAPETLRPIARYKIGYATDDWGMRSSTPSGIPDRAGAWVRYEDHLAALVEAQQPAPSAAANTKTAELLSTAVGLLMGYREGGARQPYKQGSVIAKVIDEVVDHLKDWPYPEPSPTPQADSQPAPEYVGNGMFKGETIEKAAEHWANWCDVRCMTGLSEFLRVVAAHALADSVTAPAGPSKSLPYEPTSAMLIAARERDPALPIETVRAIYWSMWRTAPTPAAQAAESVLEDAARLDWLALAGPVSICVVIDRPHDGEVEVSTDDVTGYGKTLREALDAARKQGGKP